MQLCSYDLEFLWASLRAVHFIFVASFCFFRGSSDLWVGQNERTLEFGTYIKSETQPHLTKIPAASSSPLSPDNVNPVTISTTSSVTYVAQKQERYVFHIQRAMHAFMNAPLTSCCSFS